MNTAIYLSTLGTFAGLVITCLLATANMTGNRISELSASLGARITDVGTSLGNRMTSLEVRMNGIEGAVRDLGERVTRVETQLDLERQ